MIKTTGLVIAVLCMLIRAECFAQNYYESMGKAIKKAIGFDLKDFQIFSFPTSSFGLITIYENSVCDSNFLCEMWDCLDVNDANAGSAERLNLKHFAGIVAGGIIEISDENKRIIAAEAILPKIYDVIGVTGGFRKEQTTEINITIGKAYLRKLKKDQIYNHIKNLDNSKSVKKAYKNGTLIIVVADCVIENITVSVKVKPETTANLDAKLGVTGSTAAATVFQDASLYIKVERSSSGIYTFHLSHPVIFARLIKKQPGAGVFGASDDFSDWTTVVSTLDKSVLANQ